jgi:magnesium transporter
MLVGTGGNAGGQSAAVVIQGLANGSIRLRKDVGRLLTREMTTSLMIALVLVVIGFFRVYLTTKNATLVDSLAVAASLGCIVVASMAVGTCLPLFMQFLMERTRRYAFSKVFDPATTTFPVFQVSMDILGIIITCVISYSIYATLDPSSSTDTTAA